MKIISILIFVVLFSSAALLAQNIGSKAPDFSAKDLQGNLIKLSDMKDKVVLIDFWASWCVPSKKSMPHIVELYNDNKDKSFAVIAVNVDNELKKLKEFEKDLNLNFPFTVIFDKDSEIPPLYEVEGMPTTVVIDKEGKIRYKEVGYNDGLKEKLDKILTELITK